VVRGQEEENVEETQVTCGKTARKRATSAAAVVILLIYFYFYFI